MPKKPRKTAEMSPHEIRASVNSSRIGKPPAKPSTALGRYVRELRLATGRTVAEAAEKAGVDLRWWHHLERKGEKIELSHLKSVAKVLGVTPTDLIEKQGKR